MLNQVNQIVSVGTVDGVLSTAAVLRSVGDVKIEVEFIRPFEVDELEPSDWAAKRNVLLVDLGVNNRNKQTTIDFLQRLTGAGHNVIGILDEHNADNWKEVFKLVRISFDSLTIKPVSQKEGKIESSGALLLNVLGDTADDHTRDLCKAADAADHMDFSGHFNSLVNQAIKSKIADNSRRIYLAKHFSKVYEPDGKIRKWVTEYREVLKIHEKIIGNRKDLDQGIVRIDTGGKKVDMTSLLKSLYENYSVVITESKFRKKTGEKIDQVTFGRKPGLKINLLSTIKKVRIPCAGFAAKVNLALKDEEVALAAVRQALS